MHIDDLRQVLFDTIKSLREGNVSEREAEVIVKASHAIIDTAKVEVDYIRAINGDKSNFLQPRDNVIENDVGSRDSEVKQISSGVVRTTVHKLI